MNRAKLLALIWNSNLFDKDDIEFFPEKDFSIINRGMPQEGANADFSQAILLDTIGGKHISGGIKIDINSSDWRKQQTIGEPCFDNIMLHLVEHYDTQLIINGKPILTCRLTPKPQLTEAANRLAINCTGFFAELSSIERAEILSRLLDERIERKTKEILSIFDSCQQSWQDTMFIAYFRAMGMAGRNKSEFETIARAIGYKFISLHRKDFDYILAYIFGTIGMLDEETATSDDYSRHLDLLYTTYKAYNIENRMEIEWGKSKSRPTSFSSISLVRAIAILCERPMLFEDMFRAKSVAELKKLFDVNVPEYWQTHSSLGKGLHRSEAALSGTKIESLLINFTIPLLFAIATQTGKEEYAEKGNLLYESLNSENFSYLAKWKSASWCPSSAFDSQALVQLNDNYCRQSRCLECPLGTRILQKEWKKFNQKNKEK